MQDDQFESQLVDALRDSDLADLAGTYAELGLKALLEDEILHEIPVLGTLQKLYNVGGSIRNYLFMKKLINFLVNIKDVPREQRQKQIAKLAVDVNARQRVGENLMLLLDKMNNMSKPAMMARALRAYLLEQIDVSELNKLWHVIDVIDVAYIAELKQIYLAEGIPDQVETEALPPSPEHHHLAICGLLMFDFGELLGATGSSEEQRNRYGKNAKTIARFQKGGFKKNYLGALFVNAVL